MKKLFLVLILAIGLSGTLSSQEDYEKNIVNVISIELANSTTGVITNPATEANGMYIREIILPNYYDIDLIIMTVDLFISSYNDVEHEHAWVIKEGVYFKFINFKETLFIIGYKPKESILLVSTSS